MRKLVLFDFDGTITHSDTLFDFARFVSGSTGSYLLRMILLMPTLLAFRLSLLSAQRTKEIFLARFIKGKTVVDFENECQHFSKNILPGLIRLKALDRISTYQKEEVKILIVSASLENWIIPWAETLGIEVIATKLQFNGGRVSGKIKGRNCNDDEKVVRIKEKINLSDYTDIVVYGDSKGDIAMMNLATEKHFKPFRDKS
jgi:phosphatidylglycerophosphatase C